jgi:hypothetical protein
MPGCVGWGIALCDSLSMCTKRWTQATCNGSKHSYLPLRTSVVTSSLYNLTILDHPALPLHVFITRYASPRSTATRRNVRRWTLISAATRVLTPTRHSSLCGPIEASATTFSGPRCDEHHGWYSGLRMLQFTLFSVGKNLCVLRACVIACLLSCSVPVPVGSYHVLPRRIDCKRVVCHTHLTQPRHPTTRNTTISQSHAHITSRTLHIPPHNTFDRRAWSLSWPRPGWRSSRRWSR